MNETKSWLITKNPDLLLKAKELFSDSGIKFTIEGKRHLGAAIGSDVFREAYAKEKVEKWCKEMDNLCHFAKTEPHAAYAAFCHGEMHKYTYFIRTIPEMENFIKPLDNLIEQKFIPTLLDSIVTENDRQLYSLPVKFGGLGIPIFSDVCNMQYEQSQQISAPLKSLILSQSSSIPDSESVKTIRREKTNERMKLLKEKTQNIDETLTPEVLKAVKDTRQQGASSWLSVLPLKEHGFSLNKGEFRDAIRLRYGKDLKGLPSQCPCGQPFNITHALNCKRGGFISMRHNNIRDFEAELLAQAHKDVEIEPPLQPLAGEIVNGLDGDNARPDIRAKGVWRPGQNAYFDIRVSNTNAESYRHLKTETVLQKQEREKKRNYNQRIMNVEHGTFTPLVFSVTGVMGKECQTFHKHLADKISRKTEQVYSDVIKVIRCKMSFLILRAALMCVRGSRSHQTYETVGDDLALISINARL